MDIVAMGEAKLRALALHDLGHETLSKKKKEEKEKADVATPWLRQLHLLSTPKNPYRAAAVAVAELGRAGPGWADKRCCRCLR